MTEVKVNRAGAQHKMVGVWDIKAKSYITDGYHRMEGKVFNQEAKNGRWLSLKKMVRLQLSIHWIWGTFERATWEFIQEVELFSVKVRY